MNLCTYNIFSLRLSNMFTSARIFKVKAVSALFSLSALASLVFPASTLAAFQQEQYYDWGVSERRSTAVLGLKVFAQETDTGSLTGTFDPTKPPEGFEASDLPAGFDLSTLPSGFDPANPPEGLNPKDSPQGFTQEALNEFAPGGEVPGTTTETTAITADLISGGILPTNPLHFFEKAYEGLQEAFTFNPEAKAELKLQHAEERLAEAETLIDAGNIDAGTQQLKDYEDKVTDATNDLAVLEEQGVDITDFAEQVEQATAKHTTVLEEVAVKVPESAAPAIQDALLASQTGMDRAADAKGEPPIPIDLLARMNALRGQGILTEEEASSLVNAPSREEARQLFQGFVDQGVLPEADFKRFDTAQAKYLPEQFVKYVEIRKFNELKRLEESGAPDQQTQNKLQDFASTFKSGDIVPPDLRKYWAQTVRLEEVQKTLRPDLLNAEDFKGREQDFSKLRELQDRVKPTANEARGAEEYLKANPGRPVPPEIQRVLDLKGKLGVYEGNAVPPQGHYQSTYLPSTLFRFSEVPFQIRSQATGGTTGTTGTTGTGDQPNYPNYQEFFQGPTYLPQPTYTPSGGTSGTTGTTGGGTPTGTSGTSGTGTNDFRYPYYPPPPTSTTGIYQQPSTTTQTAPSTSTSTTTQTAPSTSTSTYTAPSTTTQTAPSTTTDSTQPPPSSYTTPTYP